MAIPVMTLIVVPYLIYNLGWAGVIGLSLLLLMMWVVSNIFVAQLVQ